MIYNPEKIVLKNGTECILRSPMPSDAEQMLSYLRQTSAETSFMIRYPDEITLTVEKENEFLKNNGENAQSVMICAEIDGKIVGNAGLNAVSALCRMSHRASFGISILKDCWGLSIGTHILSRLIEVAPAMGFEQLELEVVCGNERGLSLYEKFGFEKIGVRKNAFKYRDGTYADEILMQKTL